MAAAASDRGDALGCEAGPRKGPIVTDELEAARDQRDPRARDGRGAEGELRAPGTPMALAPLAARVVDARHEVRRGRRPTGPTATASCCRPGTRRCCCTRCCTSPASASSSTTSATSASGARARPATPSTATPTGVEVTTGPLGQGFAQRGRHRDRREAPARALRRRGVRPPRVRDLQRRRPHGGHQPRGRVARRAPAARAPRVRLRRQPHHDRRRHRAHVQRRRARSASRRTAGTSCSSARSPRTSTRSKRACATAMAEDDRPSLVVLRSHIGYPSPKVQDTAAAHGNPLGADEVARVKEILGLPPRGLLRSRRRARALPRRRPPRRRGARRRGTRGARRGSPRTRRAPTSTTRASPAGRSRGWEQKLPTFAGRARRSRRATATKDVLSAVVDVVPGLDRRLGRPHRQHRHGREEPRRDRRPTTRAAALIHYGIREHGMGAAANGMAVSGLLPVRRHVLRVQRLHAPGGAPRRDHADARSRSCGRTTRSASARTARRTNRSSSSRRCARCPGLRVIRPADANEVAAAWRVHLDGDGPTALLLHPPEGPGARRHRRARAPPGVPRGAYVLVDESREPARPRAHRHRLRGRGVRRGARAARERGHRRCASCRCRRGICSRQQPDEYRVDGAAARPCRRSRSRPACASAGSATPTTS